MNTGRPTFMWDYNLSADDVRRLLATGTPVERRWLTERILLQARWEEIWSFLTHLRIREALPDLKLPPQVKSTWARALELWLRVEEPRAFARGRHDLAMTCTRPFNGSL